MEIFLGLKFFTSSQAQLEEEEEEGCLCLLDEIMRPQAEPEQARQNFFMENLPRLSATEFQQHFRLSIDSFEYLLGLIGPEIQLRSMRLDACCPTKQLLIALWRFATPDSYRSIVNRFGVSKTTGIHIVDRVTRALVKISNRHITWPEGERAVQTMQGFARPHGLPKCMGAVDGTHIPIPAPVEHPESYVNRKGRHSIQLQIVCDHRRVITHAYVGHVGSVHDARVFRRSPVFGYLGDESKFPEDSHLIGDAAYPLQQNLIVPYINNGHLTDQEKNFNYCHSSTRMVVERSIGLLKNRWRSLLTHLAMTRIHMIPFHVMACCVLHNICLERNDVLEVADADPAPSGDDDEPGRFNNSQSRQAGEIKRRMISQILPRRIR